MYISTNPWCRFLHSIPRAHSSTAPRPMESFQIPHMSKCGAMPTTQNTGIGIITIWPLIVWYVRMYCFGFGVSSVLGTIQSIFWVIPSNICVIQSNFWVVQSNFLGFPIQSFSSHPCRTPVWPPIRGFSPSLGSRGSRTTNQCSALAKKRTGEWVLIGWKIGKGVKQTRFSPWSRWPDSKVSHKYFPMPAWPLAVTDIILFWDVKWTTFMF